MASSGSGKRGRSVSLAEALTSPRKTYVTVTGKVGKVGPVTQQEVSGTDKSKQFVTLDDGSQAEVCLWEDETGQVKQGDRIEVIDVRSNKFRGKTNLTTTPYSKLNILERVTGSGDGAKQAGINVLTDGFGRISLEQTGAGMWKDGELNEKLKTLYNSAAVEGSMTYIYKLWKSLLNKWFSVPGTRVYLVSPFLDTPRLVDVIQIILDHDQNEDNLEKFYVRNICDGTTTVTATQAGALKKAVDPDMFGPKDKFGRDIRSFVTEKIFPRMYKDKPTFHCKFIAAITVEGIAEVLVTSANFSRAHFEFENRDTVQFLRMAMKAFWDKMIRPIDPTAPAEAPAGAT